LPSRAATGSGRSIFKVTVTAQVLAAKRNDAALEQIVGRLSLEPHISAVTWEVSRSIPEA
jgi:putative Mg2+ transporter-C (MgtC) family protein